MSKKTYERERIKKYLLNHISQKDEKMIGKTVDACGVSRTTVYRYLSQLEEENVIERVDGSPFKYRLKAVTRGFTYDSADKLDEDVIFHRDIQPLLEGLPKNIFTIWYYGFTEMMNNAIEHSRADRIGCIFSRDYLKTEIYITDDGIGIFQNIIDFAKKTTGEELSVEDAVIQLTAGKFTTAREKHSGEGIFFTSRAFDDFFIFSDGQMFTHTNFRESAFVLDDEAFSDMRGTRVNMQLSNTSRRDLARDVFNRFSDDNGFLKTQIPIAQIFPDGYPMSRSEARRLASSLTRFKEAELDFKDVESIGQAFAHEIFVVFENNHPDIALLPTNCNASVENMINHVLINE